MNKTSIYSRYFTYIKPVAKLPFIKTYGSTIFTIIITLIFIIFAIKPTIETILVLQKQLSNSGNILKQITKKADDLSAGRKNYDNLDQNIKNTISTAIPDSPQLKSLVKSLEESAKAHGASVSAMQIQPIEFAPGNENSLDLSEIGFTFNVTGQYQNLIQILQDLKSSDRLISIDNLSISQLTEGSGLIMSITGKSYFIK